LKRFVKRQLKAESLTAQDDDSVVDDNKENETKNRKKGKYRI